jgi:lipooligosaccharide transport system ATP-binding protein
MTYDTADFAIEVKNLTKNYNGFTALKNVSFDVKTGDFFGIIGPNGAGKTTLLKILYAFINIYAGDVAVSGLNLKINSKKIKYSIGVVPQDDNLDEDLSVFENLIIYSMYFGIPKKESLKRSEELLDFFNITDKKKSKVSNLSGGLRRRLLIARALVNNPSVIILDEPTIGLDPEVRQNIWNKLKILNKNGVTILMATHYMEEAEELFKNIIILNHGEIVIKGVVSDLIYGKDESGIKKIKSLEEIFMNVVKGVYAENFNDSF